MAADFLLRAVVYPIYQDSVLPRDICGVTGRLRVNKYGAN